jgi:hypothetical protein
LNYLALFAVFAALYYVLQAESVYIKGKRLLIKKPLQFDKKAYNQNLIQLLPRYNYLISPAFTSLQLTVPLFVKVQKE